MTEKVNNIVTDVPEKGSEDINKAEAKTEEKMFTQSQLDKFVSERIARERRNNEGLMSVKQLLKVIASKGIVKQGSYADMAKQLVDKITSSSTENEKTSGPEARETAEISAAADADKNIYAENINGGKNEEKQEGFVEILSKIKAKYPEETVEKMLSGNMFEHFARGKSGSPEEIFDDYYEFFTAMSGDTSKNQAPELASTAFSCHSGTICGTNLTKQQMEIAKSAGMSYREYSDLLESIPKRGQRVII